MDKTALQVAAEALWKACQERKALEQPLTEIYPDITITDAYQIQLINVDKKKALGRKVVGKKIGLTSRAMQQMLGVHEPDYGHVTDDMIGDEEVAISRSKLLQPKIEAEIAFVLKDRLVGPGVTLTKVLQATAGVIPVFEIIDSRIKDWKIKIQDTIADNASSAMVVLGSKLIPVDQVNLKYVGLVLEKNGEIIDTAAGAAVLGHPALAVAWLANKLSEFGIALEPGEIILSGSLTKAYEVTGNDHFVANFGPLGSVKVKFTD
ncbi:2-keto-4-pentenoate hydratase [Carboxydothermus hydrogenoformans]|uniref:Hydratase/decarboxylase family protein n=1 Tax=Carboxydothermus hydrogenoformans (strain ATCC BAA-161 / DSM 6008 / Z-2901) TaxID=246194 RepID=Q3ACM2_CARHZ|nr:fumarylacetoacetate hydrolase family protein [Carboxydothermus hydrogenoformans]ABB13965.1 hydratase/decarboxylase family protein [Carboxydothermus hydrogenoformans Z-2901]